MVSPSRPSSEATSIACSTIADRVSCASAALLRGLMTHDFTKRTIVC